MKVVRSIARGGGLVSTLVLLAFVFGGAEPIRFTMDQAVAFLFFPVGVVAGFAVAWRHELAGGLITLGSLALFYVYLFVVGGRFPGGPYFLLFALPGFLHTASDIIAQSVRRRVAGTHGPCLH